MADPLALATVALQAAIVVAGVEGVRRRNVPAVVNAAVSFAATLVPVLVGLGTGLGLGPTVDTGLTLWIALAGFLHAVGMLGPYDTVGWWDVLTHGVSAALVAALLYAAALVAIGSGWPTRNASVGVIAVTLLATFAVGVFWELVELVARDLEVRYGVDPVLVHYGWRDTSVDLVVDVAGAAAVVVLDVRVFVPVAAQYPESTRTVFLGVGAAVVLGSLLMALWIRVGVGTGS